MVVDRKKIKKEEKCRAYQHCEGNLEQDRDSLPHKILMSLCFQHGWPVLSLHLKKNKVEKAKDD